MFRASKRQDLEENKAQECLRGQHFAESTRVGTPSSWYFNSQSSIYTSHLQYDRSKKLDSDKYHPCSEPSQESLTAVQNGKFRPPTMCHI